MVTRRNHQVIGFMSIENGLILADRAGDALSSRSASPSCWWR
jgi:hypothetical protein